MPITNTLNAAIDTCFPVEEYHHWPEKLVIQLNTGITNSELKLYQSFLRLQFHTSKLTQKQIVECRIVTDSFIKKDTVNYQKLFHDQFIQEMSESIQYDQRITKNTYHIVARTPGAPLPMGYTPIIEAYATGYNFGFTQMMEHITKQYMVTNDVHFSNTKIQKIEMNSFEFDDRYWGKIWHDGVKRIAVLKHLFDIS
ncbi:hypothetical protein ABTQ33_04810 [Paucilactobacillus suebicus]|uniref:Uncharacterized protein n=1 Tax=Paucilactobacillus suebicus DSM 5007 = KCTC 3549 TaxID=1423807 RepID=A0A0R1W3N4_9LACO|nr:hypothetical protein [Paucilactobacillus suebicus]KRM12266.1 hypothetical protein FD16_GL002451 [Paucilactobacillus suebicus DSM 5007 = KCTC 3549]